MTIPFIDLQSQRLRIGADIDAALLKVARSGQYIMGPAVAALERALCEFGQAPGAEAAERSGPFADAWRSASSRPEPSSERLRPDLETNQARRICTPPRNRFAFRPPNIGTAPQTEHLVPLKISKQADREMHRPSPDGRISA